jgi:hypothetical protein
MTLAAALATRPVLSDAKDMRRYLQQVPTYVPMAHLETASRFGFGGGGFGGEFADGGHTGNASGLRKAPSLWQTLSVAVFGEEENPRLAPRPNAAPPTANPVMSALGLGPSASSAKLTAVSQRRTRRSSVAAVVSASMGLSELELDGEYYSSPQPQRHASGSRAGARAGSGAGSPRSGSSRSGGGSSSRVVPNPLAAPRAVAQQQEREDSGSDETGDAEQITPEDGEAQNEPQNEDYDSAPPRALPPPPPSSAPPPLTSTSAATSVAAFNASRRARLEMMQHQSEQAR